jgi:UDP-sulfoquinovose synthase
MNSKLLSHQLFQQRAHVNNSVGRPFLAGKTALILGGDGFCGWPMALRFSQQGGSVTVLDNGSRREIDSALGVASATRIRPLDERVAAWADVSGQQIGTRQIDLAVDYADLVDTLRELRPDILVHFAEQRSAPYSMLSSAGARYSIDNNIRTTHNLLAALVETGLDAHLLHLGTIGVYGYATAGIRLPEGYVQVTARGVDGRQVEKEILYPGRPDSVYHLTKVLDQQLCAYYAQRYGLRITDLHQGVVWGTQTAETRADPRLVNRFDHDAVYGTVVNRFLMQAFEGRPLTVYGTGRQTRAFVHIEDMLTCIGLAAATPPQAGDRLRILNQFSEICSINGLAACVAALTGAEVAHVDNPRREPEDNEFDVDRSTLSNLGFTPRTFADTLAEEIADIGSLLSPESPDASPLRKCTA